MVTEKRKKEQDTKRKKDHNAFMKLWRIERDCKQKERVAAQKLEKAQVRELKECEQQGKVIPLDSPLYIPIFDPEKDWKDNNSTWQALLATKQVKKTQVRMKKQDKDENKEEIQFITDTTGDPALQQDFFPFQPDDDGTNSQQSDNKIHESLGYY